MEVKNYFNLNSEEKIKAREFIKEKRNLKDDEAEKSINSKMYNNGEGVLFLFENGEIQGSLSVILEFLRERKTGLLHNPLAETKEQLELLINKSFEVIDKVSSIDDLYLGIRDEEVKVITSELGYKIDYSVYKMKLKGRELKLKTLDKELLSEENLEEYMAVYKKSFLDMPHGNCKTFEETKEFLNEMDEKSSGYIIKESGQAIGFLEIEIKEDNKGFFDIGLIREARGKGYGKRILETAIETLNEKNVEEVYLIVIGKNKIGYDMYVKRGFEIKEKMSDWYKII
ncbi:GNAT family N-acetyltransferase [Clostridium sp.]|uniref:GNAT family N-acetyltransferase n=1 Tax=Clostridium sp. TaxID=1506 RepID=UPI0026187EB4|nr:GNAT family N-acetyltransferase [Clostridium sp.]